MSAVAVRNLSKSYPLGGSQTARLRHVFGGSKSGSADSHSIWALQDVSFSVERGEAFGIIGANGSGKSTLLQIIAGILRPGAGTVEVSGRLSALLELGSGFAPEFTGRDNVYLNASILGLSRAEIEGHFEAIERFAGIGDFIDQPVKTYSTGMVLRLAFAVAAHVDAEILIVDEALAVGDIAFRQRCMHRIHDLQAKGTTILFVSHEAGDVKALCKRCLWLQNGRVEQIGEADEVAARYLASTLRREIAHSPARRVSGPPRETEGTVAPLGGGHRYGDGRVKILGAALTGLAGAPLSTVKPHERVSLRIDFETHGHAPSLIAGFLLRNAKGENIFGSNTARENCPLPCLAAGQTGSVQFHWTSPDLAPGDYSISVALSDGDVESFEVCDYLEDAIRLAVRPGTGEPRGYFRLRCVSVAVHTIPASCRADDVG